MIKKINKAKRILLEAEKKYGKEMAIAWTGGKDSTVIIHLCKTLFNDSVPFQVFFNDSTMEFDQVYEFIKKISKEWNFDLEVVEHLPEHLKEFYETKDLDKKKELSRTMKIAALNYAIEKFKWKALVTGIRWDEHDSRSTETELSPRDSHMRVHPILHFTESDIWEYIKKYKVPYVSLYDQGYRSLGEAPFTFPAKKGEGERSGRNYDKEILMKKLRSLGYY